MALIPKVQVTDPVTASQVNRFQDTLRAAVNPFLSAMTPGNSVSVTMTSGTPTPINHLLGRAWTGWYVIDVDAATSIFRVGNANPQEQITLQSVNDADVTLVIF